MSSAQPSPLGPEAIARDATWLAQALDPSAGQVRLIAMNRASYRSASFLDDRMLQQPVDAQIVAWPTIEDAMPGDLRSDARWIFHIGHVGSTLVARLLGELDSVLSIREPRALRDISFFPPDVRGRFVPTLQALFARTFAPHQTCLLKATSFVSEIAAELVPADGAALYLYATPRAYISGILAGENSRLELAGMASTRAERLASRGLHLPQARHEADLAAIAWACGMTALEKAAGSAALWLDFDRVLCDIERSLHLIAKFFGFDDPDE